MSLNRPLNTIGGSDIAAIMGVSSWKSPIDVYRRIVDGHDPQEDNDMMALGRALESGIASEYIRRNKLEMGALHPETFHIAKNHGTPLWANASPDGLFVDGPRLSHGAEYKVAIHAKADKWGPEGTDEIPEAYLFQVAWYTWYFDVPYWDIAAILPFRGYQQFRYTRNVDLENLIINRVTEFWRNCELKIPPPPDGSTGYDDFVKILPKPETLPSTPFVDNLVASYLAAKRAVSDNEKEVERCKQLLAQHSNGATIRGDGFLVRSKEWSRKTTSWKSVVEDVVIPDEVIAKHTKISSGVTVEIKEM